MLSLSTRTMIHKSVENKFKERLLEFIQVDATKIKEKISKQIQTLTNNCQLIIYAINSQELGIEKEQKKEIINTAFYYKEENKKYEDWLTNNINGENDFSFKVYIRKHYISNPFPQIQYDEVMIYITMNYIELGVI